MNSSVIIVDEAHPELKAQEASSFKTKLKSLAKISAKEVCINYYSSSSLFENFRKKLKSISKITEKFFHVRIRFLVIRNKFKITY